MITTHLIPDIMGSISIPGVKVGKVPPKLDKEIEGWPSDYNIKRLIQWHWFINPYDCGFEILSAASIADIEKQSANLKSGYLQIGDCPNGDRVYLKESDFSVWYWSHDEASEWEKIEKSAMKLAYPSVDYLLLAVRNRQFVPCDSYSAREYFLLMFSNRQRQV